MKITGKDIIALGYNQGKWFKEALAYIQENKLEGADFEKYIASIAPIYIEPHSDAVPFYKNIRAENVLEQQNIEAVSKSMDSILKTPTVINGAIMPDACPTGPNGQMPVGGIVVAKDAIHPAMHSADICCSLMMTSFGHVDPKKVLDQAHAITHFGGGGREDLFDLPQDLESKIKSNYYLKSKRSFQLAQTHLGTQGDGNHFLYVGQSEKTGETIMVTHHGSRGFGANLYKEGMKAAERFRKELSPKTQKQNAWLPYSHPQGEEYWEALQLVREWTKLNHKVLHQATCQGLNIDPTQRFWNEHNFVFKDGEDFYHAKGATPLDDKFVPDSQDGLRLIPLNMKEPILIVKGDTTKSNLGFAPHGAGRNVSRSQHIRSKAGRSFQEVFAEETKGIDARFYSGHVDISELPSAYKNAKQVKDQMKEFSLGNVVDEILPYGCIMAGDWQIDAPWRKRKR